MSYALNFPQSLLNNQINYFNADQDVWHEPRSLAFSPTSTSVAALDLASQNDNEDTFGNSSRPKSLILQSGLRSRKSSAHRKSATADSPVYAHPLQESVSHDPMTDDSITRPFLSRWLAYGTDSEDGIPENAESKAPTAGPSKGKGETIVIVHEVSRTDSLAGVALKYGISLADLRRANQLWASDTIHLRKILYIPLHLTNRKYEHLENLQMLADSDDDPAGRSSQHNMAVIQRIPVSQLAFFPPPQCTYPGSEYDPQRKYKSTRPSPTVSPTPVGPTVFSSLLQSISFPSRELLFSGRRSFDSSDASSASISNISETSSDRDHEMDILGVTRQREKTPTGKKFPLTPTFKHKISTNTDWQQGVPQSSHTALQCMPESSVQTSQMQPSPKMEIPRHSRHER